MLEGEYAVYNLIWNRDYGLLATLDQVTVDNEGRCYIGDYNNGDGFIKNFDATEINDLTYRFTANFMQIRGPTRSMTGKYVLGYQLTAPITVDVWRYGVLLYSINPFALEPDAAFVSYFTISPSGKFIALIIESTFTGTDRYVMLFEGV